MLIRNILTSTGLVNGAIGMVHSLEYFQNTVTTVNVLFDDRTVGQTNTALDTHDPIPISHIRKLFALKVDP